MNSPEKNKLYTIGHSTRSFEEFLALLQSFNIKILADIRRLPGSRKFPQFDQDELKKSLAENGIEYIYLEGLGGRRKPATDSKNTSWRNKSFQAYADYMETDAFAVAASELAQKATETPTAIMCSEAVWWRCHRSMVSDYFKAKEWLVLHIMAEAKATEHPYTGPATVRGNIVSYENELPKDR